MDSHSKLSECRIIELPRHSHAAGTIAVAENGNLLPFAIKRLFYIFDIPSDTERGGHAHIKGEQLVLAVAGSFTVTVTDGKESKKFVLNRPYLGLYLPSGIWLALNDFSSGCVCLTLCSNHYDESDYIRDFNQYLNHVNSAE